MKKKFRFNVDAFAMILWCVYFIFVLILFQTDITEKRLMQMSLIAIAGLLAIILRAITGLMKTIVNLLNTLSEKDLLISKLLMEKYCKPEPEDQP